MNEIVLAMALIATPFNVDIIPINVSKYGIRYFIGNKPVTHIRCHKSLAKPLIAALECVMKQEMHLGKRILINYAGCHVPRRIHGSKRWSNHRWGAAIDINVTQPASRQINTQDPALVKCFKDQGFQWGGDWKNKDYMHFERPTKA